MAEIKSKKMKNTPILNFKRLYTYLLFLWVLIILSSCIPWTYDYYKPSAPDGKLVHYWNDPLFGPKSSISFQIEGVESKIVSHGRGLHIVMNIPEGKSAQLMSDEIALYENKPENIKYFKITRATYIDVSFFSGEYVTINPTDKLVGHNHSRMDRMFDFDVEFDERARDHFFILLPKIRFGEQLYEFPVIEFVKKTGFGIHPIND